MKRFFTFFIFIALTSFISAQATHYLGHENSNMPCSNCHNATVTSWSATGHATAQDSVSNSHYGYDCLRCHNTGWNPDVTNMGADEFVMKDTTQTPNYVITDAANWNLKKNVQCESCHGPVGDANGNLAAGHFSGDAPTYFTAENCGQCHSEGHHPYMEQWQESAHASGAPAFFTRANNSSCYKCHFAQDFIASLEDPDYDAANFEPVGGDDNLEIITCVTCHDPHGNDNPGNLRALPEGHEGDVICDVCHTSEIDEVDYTSTPHHTTSEALDGSELFGYQYPGETYQNSFHTNIGERCVACHVHMEGYNSTTGEAVTGHNFEPAVEACQECHNDYDVENFDYRGVQTEIAGLMTQLQEKLDNATSTDSTTAEFYQARYNLLSIEQEGSHGIHNTKLTRKLLQDAIASNFVTALEEVPGVPNQFTLHQNYPNPFNPTTNIKFELPKPGNVKLIIYDTLGKEVEVLVNSDLSSGVYNYEWDGANLASGVYFYKLVTKDYTSVKKMILLK